MSSSGMKGDLNGKRGSNRPRKNGYAPSLMNCLKIDGVNVVAAADASKKALNKAKSLGVDRLYADYHDLFINVPKLKIMPATKITCAMKNIFGCICVPKKVVYHPFLDEAIVGINKILRPHLTIVEGLVGLGRFPVKLGLIMASVDPFSIDWVASQIMGYNPPKVGFLKVAMKEKLGNLDGITTSGESVAEFQKIFPKENFISSRWLLGIGFWLLKAYQKTVGDVIPPALEKA